MPDHPAWEGTTIWIMTSLSWVKARNLEQNQAVAMHWETNEAGDGLLAYGVQNSPTPPLDVLRVKGRPYGHPGDLKTEERGRRAG